MNKTIKQAERYEAPSMKEHVLSMLESLLQSSVESNSIESFNEEETL